MGTSSSVSVQDTLTPGASPLFAKPEMGSIRCRVRKIRRRPWPSAARVRPASVPARTRAAPGLPQGLDAVSHGRAFRLRRRSRAALRRKARPYGYAGVVALRSSLTLPRFLALLRRGRADLLQARYYDPELGRFISSDPFEGYPDLPESQNRYTYAHNNPLKWTDPNGRVIETVWNIANIAWRAGSALSNLSQGHYGAATTDVLGVILDTAAAVAPGTPGGATAGIRAARGGDKIVKGGEETFHSKIRTV